MNSYDLGCGPGGGDTAPQVFKAAGLAFSDGDHRTEIRKSEDRGGRGVGGGDRRLMANVTGLCSVCTIYHHPGMSALCLKKCGAEILYEKSAFY